MTSARWFSRQFLSTTGLVLLSLVITFLRAGFLNGSFAGLLIAVITQVYLPGYLLARVLGKHTLPHPILRFCWILGCGLALTVCLAAAARLFNIQIPVYLLILHIVMLILSLLPGQQPSQPMPPWRLNRSNILYYGLVVIACLVVTGVSYESLRRFWGFEDQPIFISLIDWLVHNPGERPNDLPLRARQIGVIDGDPRFDVDGWSTMQAGWVWTSGVPAVQLIWYDMVTLFVWTIPLITFALVYQITERESLAAWSVVGLVLAGLVTFDNLAYNPTYTAFGHFAVFNQVNTIRQASLSIPLPLALMTVFAYLKGFARRDFVITALWGVTLASLHPIIVVIFVCGVGATLGIHFLAAPSRVQFRKLLPLALLLVGLLAIPYIQRITFFGLRSGFEDAPSIVTQPTPSDQVPVVSNEFVVLNNLPLIGTTYVRNPAAVFYSPVILLAVILGLVHGWFGWKSLASQYLFASTLVTLILFFTPGLTALLDKFLSSVGLQILIFILPIGFSLGYALDFAARFIERFRLSQSLATAFVALICLVSGALLLFEPIPIRASARDQIIAYNTLQAQRYEHPSQQAVVASLKAHLPSGQISILLTAYDISNLVIEDLSGTLITGGRTGRNLAADGTARFLSAGTPTAPWLDSVDLEFIQRFGVTHIVVTADNTRVAQMLLQPERFELLETPAGYMIFRVQSGIQANAADALFERMNTLYAGLEQPRWGVDDFRLFYPPSPELWAKVAQDWEALGQSEPDKPLVSLGQAYTEVMIGRDREALNLWDQLRHSYPGVSLYSNAVASLTQWLDPGQDALAPLIADLHDPEDETRVLAARRLLTETFFYRLTPELIAQIIAVTEANAVTWDKLANLDQPDWVRRRVALMMNRGEWAKAQEWLGAIPQARLNPADILASAAIRLAEGDVDGALAVLKPTTDADWLTPNVITHPDRWANNTAAQAYNLLKGNIAQQSGALDEARGYYQQAIEQGAAVAGAYFLAQVLESSGEAERAKTLLSEAEAAWGTSYDEPLPELVSLLNIAQGRWLYVTQPQISINDDESTLTITADYADFRPHLAYPIRQWRIQVVSPDAQTQYAALDVPARFADGAMVRLSTEITLPEDIPPLTSALVFIEPRYNNAVVVNSTRVPLLLNRPSSVDIPPDASKADLRFGDAITLQAYSVVENVDDLVVTLYWKTDQPTGEDYQVFVHRVNTANNQLESFDSAPLEGRYPVSQWRGGATIADVHHLPLGDTLANGQYQLRIGLYRLSDNARLPISPADERIEADSVMIYQFDH